MQYLKALLLTAVTTSLVSVSGCAAAYHSYAGCQVNCHYCPPSPLRYASYGSCGCHSEAVTKYLGNAVQAPDQSQEPALHVVPATE